MFNPSVAYKKNLILLDEVLYSGGAGGICCISALRKLRSQCGPARIEQVSARHLYWIVQIPRLQIKITPIQMDGCHFSGGAGGI
jgi:hypothetical protein